MEALLDNHYRYDRNANCIEKHTLAGVNRFTHDSMKQLVEAEEDTGETKMWSEKLQEIKKLNATWGEEINDGATDREIQRFLEALGDSIGVEKIHPYINILKEVNGLEFDGFILYGIDTAILENEPKQSINGFIDNNKVWHENEWQRKYIFYGDSSLSWYTYDLSKNKYYELDKPSGDIVDVFDTIDSMLDKLFEDAFGNM